MKDKEKKIINPYFKMAEVLDEIIKDVLIEEIEIEAYKKQLSIDFDRFFILY